MPKNRGKARRSKAGFTLTEMLVTVAIIVILAAVAIPGVVAWRKSLKMTELNACARQIFIASQNSMTGLKTSGSMQELEEAGQAAGEAPKRFLSQQDGETSLLLPAGAVDPSVASNNYYIVYNPSTGTVLEVFYAEHALTADVFSLRDQPEARKREAVGYYRGGDLDHQEVEPLPKPTLEIINGEVLRADITLPTGFTNVNTRITLAVSQSSSGQSRTFSTDDPANLLPQPSLTADGNYATSLTLDSLEEGSHFFQKFWGFTAGEQIQLNVTVEYRGSDMLYLPSSVSSETNSLFAGRENDTVTIAYGRHLQNLDTKTSLVDQEVTRAVQTRIIDWSAAYPDQRFTPVTNTSLIDYNGAELPIRNLQVTAAGAAGLFGTVVSMEEYPVGLRNIRLINPAIDGGTSPTGALAGYAEDCNIDNCLVTMDFTPGDAAAPPDVYVTGKQYVGGLVGHGKNLEITASAAGLPSLSGTGGAVGGLVGYLEGTFSLEDSYASIDQLSGTPNTAAMLIGSLNGTSGHITHCYAVGNISVDSGEVSGFVGGDCARWYFQDSYCAVTYRDPAGDPLNRSVYGFAQNANQWYCAYLTPDTQTTVLENSGGGPVGYEELQGWTGSGGNFWVNLTSAQSHSYTGTQLGLPYPFPGIKYYARETNEERVLPQYGSWPEPVQDAEALFVYYEWYHDGSYGFHSADGTMADLAGDDRTILETGYGVLISPSANIASVGPVTDNEAKPVGNPFALVSPSVSAGGAQYALYALTPDAISQVIQTLHDNSFTDFYIGENAYYINPKFAAALIQKPNDLSLGVTQPYQVRTESQLAAMCAFPGELIAVFQQTHSIPISDSWVPAGSSIGSNQLFDGGGFSITGLPKPLFSTIGGGTVRNVTIQNAGIQTDVSTGIFAAACNGTVENCRVLNSSIKSDRDASGFIDTLNQEIISSCSVLGTQVEAVGIAAGFVKTSNASISNCCFSFSPESEAQGYAGASVSSQKSAAAGFVYEAQESLNNNYAVAKVHSDSDVAAGFIIKNSLFNIISDCYANCETLGRTAGGFVEQNYGYIQDCYALLSVTGEELASGFSVGILKGFPLFDGAYSNCYSAASIQSGGTIYGFAPAILVTNCYYLEQSGEENDRAEEKTWEELSSLQLGGSWVTAEVAASHPLSPDLKGQAYPFPRLAALEHYGDWPVGQRDGQGSLGIFYYRQHMKSGMWDGTYDIVAVSLEHDLADWKDPVLINEEFYRGNTKVANHPGDIGYGIFWSKELDPSPGGQKRITYNSGNGDRELSELLDTAESKDLKVLPDFYFVPISGAGVQLAYHHDNSQNHILRYEFTFDKNTEKLIVTEKKSR